MKEGVWQKWASILLCMALGLLLLRGAVSYVQGPLAVAVIAFLVATAVQTPAKRLSANTRLSPRLCAAFLVLLLFLFLGMGLWLGITYLWRELRDALGWLSKNWDSFMAEIGRRLGILFSHGEEGMTVSERLSEWLWNVTGQLGTSLAAKLGDILRSAPTILMLFCVTFLASLYLGMDYHAVGEAILSLLSPEGQIRAIARREKLVTGLLRYGRAYLLLMLLTFLEALVGLMILGQPMSFLLALCVAVVDVLPILGAGTVLIPWGLLSLAGGNTFFGIGLLVLYGVITVVRQLVEPRLIGGSLGLHPLLALSAMFLGFWCFGVFGMIVSPFVALLIREGIWHKNGGKEGKQEKS
ncbi:MAG: AI-2E family transporter [Clostridia bacterium]|nr:AI-2E family transporter [Clostridia bacterium]